jgi:NAD(P)-dependent dehydrogenase (short-subunit alcohol dehydrogenase family)
LFSSPNINPHGKYVLVTGCSFGFGYALAIERDKQGSNVFADIRHLRSESLLKKHRSSRSIVFVLDINKQEEIDAAYNDLFLIVFVEKWLPGVCVLVLSNQVECEHFFSMDKKLLSEFLE